MTKTSVKLQPVSNIWPISEEWAAKHQYRLDQGRGSTRLFVQEQKKTNGKISVEITKTADSVHIHAWFSDWIRKELALDATSLYAALPRKEAFLEVQDLIARLGTTPVRKRKTTKRKKNSAFKLGRSIRKLSGKK
jgi:hypothetical protein